MLKPKFCVGDRVSVAADRTNANMRPGIYTITRALPLTAQGVQYRAKNILDSHERVLNEAQLHVISSAIPRDGFGSRPR